MISPTSGLVNRRLTPIAYTDIIDTNTGDHVVITLVYNLYRAQNKRGVIHWATSMVEAQLWLIRSECDGNA